LLPQRVGDQGVPFGGIVQVPEKSCKSVPCAALAVKIETAAMVTRHTMLVHMGFVSSRFRSSLFRSFINFGSLKQRVRLRSKTLYHRGSLGLNRGGHPFAG
jgi:hypothetical protein